MRSRRQPGPVLAMLAAGLLALAGCSGGGSDDPGVDATRQPEVPADAPASDGTVAPLTGLPIEPERATRPALVVKIDNAPRAQPQVGLGEADVVVEEEVEGGVTRFAAVFHSRDAVDVGPVRSARSTDIAIASALNRPLFAYSGANPAFQSLVSRAPLVDVGVDRAPDGYRRESGRPAPYNQFSSTAALLSRAPRGPGPPPRLFPFRRSGEPASGDGVRAAAGVDLEYRDVIVTAVQYRWDGTAGTWKRNQNGTAHVNEAGAQYAPRNVVVQFVDYRDTGFRDQSGAPVPEAVLVGEGEAWVFTDGSVVKGRWKKPSPESVTQYLDAAGAPVRLTPGRTWVELPRPGRAGIVPS